MRFASIDGWATRSWARSKASSWTNTTNSCCRSAPARGRRSEPGRSDSRARRPTQLKCGHDSSARPDDGRTVCVRASGSARRRDVAGRAPQRSQRAHRGSAAQGLRRESHPERGVARQQRDPHRQSAADLSADARRVRRADVAARHRQHHSRGGLRRARRHLCGASVVDPESLRPHQRRAARRWLGQVDGRSADRRTAPSPHSRAPHSR